jgi:hypothetical protein
LNYRYWPQAAKTENESNASASPESFLAYLV